MKVMVIDDEPDIRTYLMAALEDSGFDVCSVEDNAPIDQAVLENRPDLIILDIMMPRRSGLSIYKELRSNDSSRDIPAILISGMSPGKGLTSEDLNKLIDDDSIPLPEGFMDKPIRLPALLELVKSLLN